MAKPLSMDGVVPVRECGSNKNGQDIRTRYVCVGSSLNRSTRSTSTLGSISSVRSSSYLPSGFLPFSDILLIKQRCLT